MSMVVFKLLQEIKVQMTEVRSVFRENAIRDLMHSLQGHNNNKKEANFCFGKVYFPSVFPLLYAKPLKFEAEKGCKQSATASLLS